MQFENVPAITQKCILHNRTQTTHVKHHQVRVDGQSEKSFNDAYYQATN